MEIFITIKDDNEDGKWFTASLWENIPFVNDPPAHEAKGSTPQGALAALVANIDVNEAMAAETGVDPRIVALEHGSYVCENCGSKKVEAHAWAPLNGVINLANVEFIDDGHTWCPQCEENDTGIDFVENFSEDGEKENEMTLARPTNAPATYSQDGLGYEAIVHARYYVPGHIAVWFVTEYDSKDDEIFGWAEIIPGGGELGYTSLAELEATGSVVLDADWEPVTLANAIDNRAKTLDALRLGGSA